MAIKFTTTKNGSRRAFYRGRCAFGCRWFPISVEKADFLIATGEAHDWNS